MNQQRGEEMAGWPYESKTEVHFGVRVPVPGGEPEVTDYGPGDADKAAAAQAATMPGCQLVQFEVTTGPVAVIPNPLLEGHSDPSGS
jgi:hypothetical protein